MSIFQDRRDAGRRLATALRGYEAADTIVLALPPNGVPVAYEVACALGMPLDVFVVLKLAAPGHGRPTMGVIASGGLIDLDDDVVREQRITADDVADVTRKESHELVRLEQAYRGGRPPSNVADKKVLLVADGLVTGATMRRALRVLRKGTPDSVIAALPIAALDVRALLSVEADEVVCATAPSSDCANWYGDLAGTSDDEVRELIAKAWRSEPERTPEPVDIRDDLTSSNRR